MNGFDNQGYWAIAFICLLFALAFLLIAVLAMIGYRRLKTNALNGMTYSRSFSTDGIFQGEELELEETVSNPGWFPLFNVRMDFYVPAGITVDSRKITEHCRLTSVFNIPPYSTVKKKFTVRADKRGHFEIHNAAAKYRDNIFDYETKAEFYAYPDYFDSSSENRPDIYQSGTEAASIKFIEDPFFISGIRDYRQGDPMRAINFKASVRSFSGGARTLLCNNYDSSRTFDSMIFLDLNSYTSAIDPALQLEIGLRHACFIFREAVKNGGSVGFCTNMVSNGFQYVYIPCGSGAEHIKKLLRIFAVLDHRGKRDYSMSAIINKMALEIPEGADIYMLSSFIDDKTAEALYALKRSGRNVQIIPLEVKSLE